MSDQKPGTTGRKPGTPADKAKANGTTPAVTARKPISKADYARTTKASPDATSVIPAVRDDAPAPEESKAEPKPGAKKAEPKPSTDDRPTQMMKAVPADDAGAKAPVKDASKVKAEPKSEPKVKAEPKSDKKPAAAAGAAAATVAPAPVAPAPVAPTPARQPGPPLKRPSDQSTKTAKKSEAKPAVDDQTKVAPAAEPAASRAARLKLSHVEPWSVTKMAFVVSVALMIVSVVAVTVFWIVMQMTGVWGALNDSVSNVLADDASAFDITDYLGFGRVVGVTLLISSLNVIFMTALATIAAHLYNLAATILGGIEVTFGERK